LALGLLFVPFFNIYWIFHVYYGFARNYNALISRHKLNVPELPSSLYFYFSFLTLLNLFTSFIAIKTFSPIPFVIYVIDSAITIAIFSMTCRAVNRIHQEIYLQTTTSEPLTKKQKFVKIAKYSGIAFGVIFALTVLSAIIFGPGSSFNRIGFYILFIPLWILASIGVFKLLFLFIRILLIVMGVLCLIGFLLIISGERTLEGILTLGPVGFFVAFILGIVFSTFLISLLPGLLAGLFVGGFISDKIDSALGLICGLGVLIVVTGAVFQFIWRWIIPFSVGFSISLSLGQIIFYVV